VVYNFYSMHVFKTFLVTILIFGSLSFTTPWSEKLKLKVDNCVKSTYPEVEYDLMAMTVSALQEEKTKLDIENNLYIIKGNTGTIGYIYVEQAPSMKNVFDYAVVLSPELEIVNTKVLIYREQHGRQIGAKRWLQQFFNMDSSSRPVLGKDVDGITGATISATSMTNAVYDLLVDIDYLKSQGYFTND
jgi:Na+-translocating ferredoxin:NAD+ oxidoreductase RnfG subunit